MAGFSTLPAGIPQAVGTPLSVATSDGLPLGSFLDPAPHEIPAGGARYLQDVLLDVPNEVRQRGVIDTLGGDFPQFPSLPSNWRTLGMTSLSDPSGNGAYRILLLGTSQTDGTLHALVYGRGSVPQTPAFHARSFFFMDDDGFGRPDPTIYFDDRRTASLAIGAKLVDIPLSGITVNANDNDPFFDAKPSLDGGILIGIGQNFGPDSGASAHRALYHWRGAAKPDYNAGTIALTASSTTVVGTGTSFLANVEPGMFVMTTTGRSFGVVKSVTDNTHLELERKALTGGASGTYLISSLRRPFVATSYVNAGSITASTSSTIINGGNTKFVDQGVGNGDLVFKSADFSYVGTVSSVQSNTQLTLTANALVGLSNEDYLITRATPFAAGSEPIFSAYWQGIQLAANADDVRNGKSERTRVYVLGPQLVEAVDVTQSGTWIDLPAVKPTQDIRGIFPTESTALVFTAEQTFGLFGTTPDTLVPKTVLGNDGLVSPMAVQPWQGGAIWAGHKSVYWFDGSTVHDMLEGRASKAHMDALANLDYSQFRAWSMVYNNHFLVSLQQVNPDVFAYSQEKTSAAADGGQTYKPTSVTYAINLKTGALTFFSNVFIRGFTVPPGKLVSERDGYYVVQNSATSGPAIASAEALFGDALLQSKFRDDVITDPARVQFAPHVFIETRLDPYGDPERLKNFKQFQLQYLLYSSDLTAKLGLDVVTGLSQSGTPLVPKDSTTSDHAARTFKNVRSRFTRSGTHIAFRLYTFPDVAPSAVLVGPMAAGMKLKRPGRV